MGLVAVLNRGLQKAAGEYFAILSADDAFRPTYVERLLSALLQEPSAAFAYSAMEYFGARSGMFRARSFSPALLLAGNYVNASALTRRADALAVGGFHPNPANAYEDWDFFLRLLETGKRGVAVPEPLLRYRQHGTRSRNPRSLGEFHRVSRVVRAAHPGLYGRRSPVLRETLLFAALVASRLRCGVCLRLLDRAWEFPPPSSVRPARPETELRDRR
jgi:GT2 family glycosyltransferase